MIENSKKYLIKGSKVNSKTINLSTVESNISKELEIIKTIQKVCRDWVSIFRLGKVGVSIVSRSHSSNQLNKVYRELKKIANIKIKV